MSTLYYPAGPVTRAGVRKFLEGDQPIMGYRSPERTIEYQLMGPLEPSPGIHNGVAVTSLKGLVPPWQNRKQQGSNQDGATYSSTVYDPCDIDMGVEIHGNSPQETRAVVRNWIEAWDAKQQGQLFCVTEAGPFYQAVRWGKNPVDRLYAAALCRQPFTMAIEGDDAFWRGMDSVCVFPEIGAPLVSGNGSGFITLTNSGDQDGYANHVVYGPFTKIKIANGPSSSSMIEFGPLLENQVALLRTEPRRRGVTDLTTLPVPTQNLNQFQTIVSSIISFATNNNVPARLREFESLFGILPPQGELYSLLKGRFTQTIPKKRAGMAPVESHIAVEITGGNSNTRIVSYLTPLRRWPF